MGYMYTTVHHHYKTFYKFTLKRRLLGFIPAGESAVIKGRHYDTAAVLSRLCELDRKGAFPVGAFSAHSPQHPSQYTPKAFAQFCRAIFAHAQKNT